MTKSGSTEGRSASELIDKRIAELKDALSAMHLNYGGDDKTSPRAFLASGLPRTYLTAELSRIRTRMFFRVSDEALSDVKITNALLTPLYYRQK
jgi:hypothetical protein